MTEIDIEVSELSSENAANGSYAAITGDNTAILRNHTTSSSQFHNAVTVASLNIPANSTINSVTLEVVQTKYPTYGDGNIDLDIGLEAVDDADSFATTADVTDRMSSITTAVTAWTETALGSNVATISPDFSSSLQEIVDRDGWEANNSICILLRTRSDAADAWAGIAGPEHSTLAGPQLVVDFTPPVTGVAAASFGTPNKAVSDLFFDPYNGSSFVNAGAASPAWATFSTVSNPDHSWDGWALDGNDSFRGDADVNTDQQGWTFFGAFTNDNAGSNEGLFGVRDSTGSSAVGWDVRVTTTGQVRFTEGDGSSNVATGIGSSGDFSNATFSVAVQFSGTDTLVYVDGVLEATLDATTLIGGTHNFLTTAPMSVGALQNGGSNSVPLNGTAHGFVATDSILTAADILELHDYFLNGTGRFSAVGERVVDASSGLVDFGFGADIPATGDLVTSEASDGVADFGFAGGVVTIFADDGASDFGFAGDVSATSNVVTSEADDGTTDFGFVASVPATGNVVTSESSDGATDFGFVADVPAAGSLVTSEASDGVADFGFAGDVDSLVTSETSDGTTDLGFVATATGTVIGDGFVVGQGLGDFGYIAAAGTRGDAGYGFTATVPLASTHRTRSGTADGVFSFTATFTVTGTGDTSAWIVGAPAGIYNIYTTQGNAHKLHMRLTDSAGLPRVLNGYTIEFIVRRRITATAAAATLSTVTGHIANLGDGYIRIHVPSTVTDTLLGDNVYALNITSPQGVLERITKGDFRVERRATTLVLA
jgi:hypothetical protein